MGRRRIVTAREQAEMLLPWRHAAPWHAKEGDPTYTVPVSELQRYRQFNPAIETPQDYHRSLWTRTWSGDPNEKPYYRNYREDGFWSGGGDEGSSEGDLAEAFEHGDKLPPVEITTNGVGAMLTDGNHRLSVGDMMSRPDMDTYISYKPQLYDDDELETRVDPDSQLGKHIHDLVQTHPYKPLGDEAPTTRYVFRRHPQTGEWQRGKADPFGMQIVDTPDYLEQMTQQVPGFKDQGLGYYDTVDWGNGPELTNRKLLHANFRTASDLSDIDAILDLLGGPGKADYTRPSPRETHEPIPGVPQGWERYYSTLVGKPDTSGDAHLHLPVGVLDHYREYDRDPNTDQARALAKIISDDGGIRNPVHISTDGTHALMHEGNNRLAVAKQMGITHLPVRVTYEKPGQVIRNEGTPVPLEKTLGSWVQANRSKLTSFFEGRRLASAEKVYRGLHLDLPSDLSNLYYRLLEPPMDESEIDQHYKLADPILDHLEASSSIANRHPGIGPNWSHSRHMSEMFARGNNGRHHSVLIESDHPGDEYIDSHRNSVASEREINYTPGTPMNITGVYVPNPFDGGWLNLLKEPQVRKS